MLIGVVSRVESVQINAGLKRCCLLLFRRLALFDSHSVAVFIEELAFTHAIAFVGNFALVLGLQLAGEASLS
ncbi:MAG: hypothetical protein EBU49_11230, partial [Proteobacteria bacterium]|nr:hypothetical protein [Pseudomonadota bacterium]